MATVVSAYQNVLGAPKRLIRTAALPTATCLVVSWVMLLSPWREHPAGPLFYLIYMIPMSLLALVWTRSTLIREQHHTIPSGPWFSDYLKVLANCLVWAVLLHLWPIVFIAVWLGASYAIAGGPDAVSRMLPFVPITWLVLIVVGVLPFGRCFLALPLIITKQAASPIAAWKLGSKNGLRLGVTLLLLAISIIALLAVTFIVLTTVVYAALPLVLQIDTSLHDADYLKTWVALPLAFGLLFPLGSAIATALFAETLAIAFHRITGWSSGQKSLITRFD